MCISLVFLSIICLEKMLPPTRLIVEAAQKKGSGASRWVFPRGRCPLPHRPSQLTLCAQSQLGQCCYLGVGVQQDYAEAVRWFRGVVDDGYPEARSGFL